MERKLLALHSHLSFRGPDVGRRKEGVGTEIEGGPPLEYLVRPNDQVRGRQDWGFVSRETVRNLDPHSWGTGLVGNPRIWDLRSRLHKPAVP